MRNDASALVGLFHKPRILPSQQDAVTLLDPAGMPTALHLVLDDAS
jgi:hypothetical protein